MKSKFLNLKEFVLVLLLACLETVIGLVAAMPFAANLQLVYFLVPGLTGLINGIIYVLLIKKCPKVGTQFIIPFVYGLLFLFSGSVYVFMFFAILAVANELIMIGGYGKKVRQAIPHVLTWSLNSMGSTLTLLLFRDSIVNPPLDKISSVIQSVFPTIFHLSAQYRRPLANVLRPISAVLPDKSLCSVPTQNFLGLPLFQ